MFLSILAGKEPIKTLAHVNKTTSHWYELPLDVSFYRSTCERLQHLSVKTEKMTVWF